MDATPELKSQLHGDIADDAQTLAAYSTDASLFRIQPQAVVFPKDEADVISTVKFVAERKSREPGLSVTARCAGTDMTGGPLNASIILEFGKYLNRLTGIADGAATVEPGMLYRDFEKETLVRNLLLPSYPASREICAVGGMVANNSGGEKSLVYGKTENYVERLRVVLSNGDACECSALSEPALKEKLNLQTFEGQIYRDVYKLVTENDDAIRRAKPNVSKNSAGYALWNVWNKDARTFDLTKLIVGSQGTLGIVTQITFRLVQPKRHSQLLVVFLRDLAMLDTVVNRVLQSKPESFESFDDNTFRFAMRFLPEVLTVMNPKNVIALGLSFLPELWMTLTGGVPKLIMIAEFTGDTEEAAKGAAQQALNSLAEFRLTARLTRSEEEAKKYWVMRRESFNLLRRHAGSNLRTAPFIDDIIVRPERLPEFLPKLNEIFSHYSILYTVAGHVGDGNFHIIPLMDVSKPETAQIIRELGAKVYDLVFQFNGSTTAEHNDGLIRSPYLAQMYGADVYELFRRVKGIFDPQNILNPGKKIGGTLDDALQYLKK